VKDRKLQCILGQQQKTDLSSAFKSIQKLRGVKSMARTKT